jgi:hypothetical protein
MIDPDPRQTAEAFIDKVVAPTKTAAKGDAQYVRDRIKLAGEEAKLGRHELAAGGFDVERLDKLAAERAKARKTLAGEAKRRAVEASAAEARRLFDLVPVVPFDPVDVVIDQVTFIRTFLDQGTVLDSNVAPSENWARYRLENTDEWEGTGRLSFFTLWRNEQNTATIIMARPNLIINAHLSCDAEWNGVASWFGFDSEGTASVRARTTVWGMDSSISSIVHDELIAQAAAHGGFFGDDRSKSIAFNELLPASGVSVAPGAYVLIEVELVTEWTARSGSAVLDAESGSHRVDIPQIVLTQIRTAPPPPPISLSASVDQSTTPATATLTWSGASSATVDLYRNGAFLTTRENDGVTTVTLNPGTYGFHVCESGSNVCSNEVSVTVDP